MSWNPISPAQEQELRALLSGEGLGAFFELLFPICQHGIFIHRHPVDGNPLVESTYQKMRSSHFGGVPEVPPGFAWPHYHDQWGDLQPFEFVAQINLSEVAPYDYHHRLPQSGMLYLFNDGLIYDDCKLFYVPESELRELHLFDMMPILAEKGYKEHESSASESAWNFFEQEFGQTPPLEYMTFQEGICAPAGKDIMKHLEAMGFLQKGEALSGNVDVALDKVLDELRKAWEWLLGRDQEIQNDVFVDITSSETAEHCLLCMEEPHCNTNYYIIREDALARQGFSQAHMQYIQK